MLCAKVLIPLLCIVNYAKAVSLTSMTDTDAICAAVKPIIQGEWNYYLGFQYGGTVGMFSQPYYWWQAGECFGGMIDYFTQCDATNHTLELEIYNGMFAQAGAQWNYIPSNQSLVEGNDDQGVWGLTTMEAVERNFTNNADHSWLELTQAIYNTMNARWDMSTCGGGLRWQIFNWNSGYNYKNSIPNACLFNIAARLARYTKNDTYAQTAEKVWDWMNEVQFMTYSSQDNGELIIYDGAMVDNNCTQLTTTKWSYTYGIFMAGAAYMYNYTGDEKWEQRAAEVLTAGSFFLNGSSNVLTESSCAPYHCNNDQRSFRALYARCLGVTSVLVPSLYDQIRPILEASAQGAAASCSGGRDGVTCGMDWNVGGYDNLYGLGEQMSAAEVILALNAQLAPAPYTSTNGGSSKSDPNAGTTSSTDNVNTNVLTITTKDKAGAGVLTAVVLVIIVGGAVWMIL